MIGEVELVISEIAGRQRESVGFVVAEDDGYLVLQSVRESRVHTGDHVVFIRKCEVVARKALT